MASCPVHQSIGYIETQKHSEKQNPIEIWIGKAKITKDTDAKLLGIQFNEKQDWSTQIYGKGGVLSSLNQRLFLIRRLRNKVNKEALLRISDSLFNSKIRYGVRLCKVELK